MKNKNIIIIKINPEPTKCIGLRPYLPYIKDPLDDISKESWEAMEKMREEFRLKNPIVEGNLFIFGTGGEIKNSKDWEELFKNPNKEKDESI